MAIYMPRPGRADAPGSCAPRTRSAHGLGRGARRRRRPRDTGMSRRKGAPPGQISGSGRRLDRAEKMEPVVAMVAPSRSSDRLGAVSGQRRGSGELHHPQVGGRIIPPAGGPSKAGDPIGLVARPRRHVWLAYRHPYRSSQRLSPGGRRARPVDRQAQGSAGWATADRARLPRDRRRPILGDRPRDPSCRAGSIPGAKRSGRTARAGSNSAFTALGTATADGGPGPADPSVRAPSTDLHR